jgi:hypothetical protein
VLATKTTAATTLLTLMNGRTLEARGTYEDLTLAMRPRTMTADDGRREITLTNGERITLATTMVGMIEAARETPKRPVGFWTYENALLGDK